MTSMLAGRLRWFVAPIILALVACGGAAPAATSSSQQPAQPASSAPSAAASAQSPASSSAAASAQSPASSSAAASAQSPASSSAAASAQSPASSSAAAASAQSSAASPGAASSAKPKVPGLVSDGKLILATAGNFPPFTQVAPGTGKVEGYSIDVFGEAATRLGLQLETPTVDFVAELQGLSSGKYDVADSGIRTTPERQKQFLFTVPVASGGLVAGVLMKNQEKFKAGLSDVKGLKVSAIAGSIAEKYLLDNKAQLQYASYTGFPGAAEGISALDAERVDIFMNDATPLLYYIKQNPGKLAVVGPATDSSPFSGAIRLGNEGLQTALNKVLKDMTTDGTIAKLMKKSFGTCLPLPEDINSKAPFPNPPGC